AGGGGGGGGRSADAGWPGGARSGRGGAAPPSSPGGGPPRRGALPLAGALVCYRPYECADGWVTLGALEPKFWQAWCRGVGREDLVEQQFAAPGSDAHREVEEIFAGRSREEWRAFASEHDCCLEPVLDLDEALDSDRARARWWSSSASRGRRGRCASSGCRSSSAARRATPTAGPARRWASTRARCSPSSATARTRSTRCSPRARRRDPPPARLRRVSKG